MSKQQLQDSNNIYKKMLVVVLSVVVSVVRFCGLVVLCIVGVVLLGCCVGWY
jgi:hypothetical protein